MSIHPSLRSSQKDKKSRSVLKRSERLKTMMEKGTWKEGDDVYSLPKIKTVRIKIKKEKAAQKPEVAGTAAAATAGGEGAASLVPPAAPQAKEQTTGKGATKTQEKK